MVVKNETTWHQFHVANMSLYLTTNKATIFYAIDKSIFVSI
jgi:hypothetical protein